MSTRIAATGASHNRSTSGEHASCGASSGSSTAGEIAPVAIAPAAIAVIMEPRIAARCMDRAYQLERPRWLSSQSRARLATATEPTVRILPAHANLSRRVVRCAMALVVRTFARADETAVIALWQLAGLTRPWNDPHKDIARKLAV